MATVLSSVCCREEARQYNRRANRSAIQAANPPTATVHHAHKGNGQYRSNRMPAAAIVSTITNG
jgi:hypothetical protein